MLSSQMYRDAGLAGLLRASATAPVTAASPLCVPHLCCFGMQFRTIFVWYAFTPGELQCHLTALMCILPVSVLQCSSAEEPVLSRQPLRTGTSAAFHKRSQCTLQWMALTMYSVFHTSLLCALVSGRGMECSRCFADG